MFFPTIAQRILYNSFAEHTVVYVHVFALPAILCEMKIEMLLHDEPWLRRGLLGPGPDMPTRHHFIFQHQHPCPSLCPTVSLSLQTCCDTYLRSVAVSRATMTISFLSAVDTKLHPKHRQQILSTRSKHHSRSFVKLCLDNLVKRTFLRALTKRSTRRCPMVWRFYLKEAERRPYDDPYDSDMVCDVSNICLCHLCRMKPACPWQQAPPSNPPLIPKLNSSGDDF